MELKTCGQHGSDFFKNECLHGLTALGRPLLLACLFQPPSRTLAVKSYPPLTDLRGAKFLMLNSWRHPSILLE